MVEGHTNAPRALARFTGLLYLTIIVAAMFSEAFVRSRLIVPGDATATVRALAAGEQVWRLGLAANILTNLCDVAVAVLLFVLLRPVNAVIALTAAAFRLVYSAVMAAHVALLSAPLFLLGPATGHSPQTDQAGALILYAMRLYNSGFAAALVLFGVHLMLIGVLIGRSTFLPKIIGWGLCVAGICYVANSLLGVLAPAIADQLFPWILLPGFLAELSLSLWLLIPGVDPASWRAG